MFSEQVTLLFLLHSWQLSNKLVESSALVLYTASLPQCIKTSASISLPAYALDVSQKQWLERVPGVLRSGEHKALELDPGIADQVASRIQETLIGTHLVISNPETRKLIAKSSRAIFLAREPLNTG